MVIHVVRPGDSLYRIAQLHSIPLPFLIQQNELHEPYRLRPGRPLSFRSRKNVHRPPRRHARQHCRAEQHNRDAAVAEQSAAWRHRPHSAGQMLVLSYGNKLGRFAVNGYAYPSIDLRVLRGHCPI